MLRLLNNGNNTCNYSLIFVNLNVINLIIKKIMQIKINYPKNLPDALLMSRAQFEKDAKMAMAVKLFEMKKMPSGIAAKLAGVSRVYFLLNLHRYNVNMIDLEKDDLESDLKNA